MTNEVLHKKNYRLDKHWDGNGRKDFLYQDHLVYSLKLFIMQFQESERVSVVMTSCPTPSLSMREGLSMIWVPESFIWQSWIWPGVNILENAVHFEAPRNLSFSNFADVHNAGPDWCGGKRQGSKALPSESHLQRLTFISLKTTKIQEQILEEGTAAHLIVSTCTPLCFFCSCNKYLHDQ